MYLAQMALFCYFSGIGWESVQLKGDEEASDATETSGADMTIKVRGPFSSLILKVHLWRKRSLWQISRGNISSALHSASSSLFTEASASQPALRFPEIWDLD